MRPLDYLFTPQGRRRLRWDTIGRVTGNITFRYDDTLTITSPHHNRSARKAFVQGFNDPLTFAWLQNYLKSDMTVLDVGANVGLYSLFAANRAHRVFAFEADPATASILEKNKSANALSNLEVIVSAAGESEGILQFERDHKNIGASHVALTSGIHSDSVPVITLDGWAESQGVEEAHFIKLDVEGYEVKAIDGAKSLLERSKNCAVLTEISERQLARYGNSPLDLGARLEPLGFRAHQFSERGLVPYDWSRRLGDALWLRK